MSYGIGSVGPSYHLSPERLNKKSKFRLIVFKILGSLFDPLWTSTFLTKLYFAGNFTSTFFKNTFSTNNKFQLKPRKSFLVEVRIGQSTEMVKLMRTWISVYGRDPGLNVLTRKLISYWNIF